MQEDVSNTVGRNHVNSAETGSNRSGNVIGFRSRILIPLAALITGLIFVCGYVVLANTKARTIEESSEAFAGVQKALDAAMAEEISMMGAMMEVLSRDVKLRSLFLADDMDALHNHTKPLFERLRTRQGITHFYFHGPDRRNKLRMYKPEKNGDLITRFVAREAERTGKEFGGLEIGKHGTLTIRIVRPWYYQGELIGYLELGQEIDHTIKQLRDATGMEFVITVNKQYLDREKWTQGMEMLGRTADWDYSGDSVVVVQTMADIPDDVVSHLCDDPDVCKLGNIPLSVAGVDYRVSSNALKDVAGRSVGEVVMLREVTPETSAMTKTVRQISLACGVTGLFIVAFFYFFLGAQQRKLSTQSRSLLQARRATDALINAPEDVSLLTEPDGRILIANEAFANKSGKARRELVGLGMFELLPPKLASSRMARVSQASATGQSVRFEDIEHGRWMENGVYPIKNATGQVTRIAWFSRDVTKSRQSESELRTALDEQERMNRLLAGREERMLELKKQINDLLGELGKQPHYETTA